MFHAQNLDTALTFANFTTNTTTQAGVAQHKRINGVTGYMQPAQVGCP
jgi:hypothetical protein